MAFFSFSLLNDPLAYLSNQFEPNQKYFSKDTTLWKELNNRNKKKHICILNHEKRSRLNFLGNKLLICLPPKFGLGDAVEYCVAIKSIIENNTFSKIGIAFCSDMIFIFKDIFSFLVEMRLKFFIFSPKLQIGVFVNDIFFILINQD